jgi:hypothetical protein
MCFVLECITVSELNWIIIIIIINIISSIIILLFCYVYDFCLSLALYL